MRFVASLTLIIAILVPAAARADSPAADRYTGTWQSTAHYHFDVPYCDGVDLDLTINGTMTVAVDGAGNAAGTVSGTVDAPVTDCGGHDVSSGTGTVSGTLTGRLDSSLTLTAPVIVMHWGTYVGGNYTVEQSIIMPDYTFTTSGCDCVSAQGTITEQGFPTEQIVDDGQGHMTEAAGVGTASGQWSVQSPSAPAYATESVDVDHFIARSNALLATPLSFGAAQTAILSPLSAIQTAAGPCLQSRLNAWRGQAAGGLLSTLPAGTAPADARRAGDAVRLAGALDPSVAGEAAMVGARDETALDADLAASDWADAALLGREILLLQGVGEREALRSRLDADLAARLSATAAPALRATARAAYALGDYSAVRIAAHRVIRLSPHSRRRRTVHGVLQAGIARIHPVANAGTLTWTPVPGAARYIAVTLSAGLPDYFWSGTADSVTYGDTTLEGIADSADDDWTTAEPSPHAWHILALNAEGKIVGIGAA